MQRPVMDITYMEPAPEGGSTGVPLAATARQRVRALRAVMRILWRSVRAVVRVLSTDPLANTPLGRFRNDDGSRALRFMRGLAYRVAFLPIVAALLASAFVYSGTHPIVVLSPLDPGSSGLYYDPITFLAEDGVQLEAWLVPVVKAQKILDEKERALREKHPAVVLVHDFANGRQQMLPLVKPLHDAGFVVLAVGLRGSGSSNSKNGGVLPGQTFGFREAGDARVAVEVLRRRPFVDPKRVTVVGVGTGANAALMAAAFDKGVVAAVLDGAANGLDSTLERHVVPPQPWLRWIKPLCKWTFEIAYGVDGEELNPSRYDQLLSSNRVLVLSPMGPANEAFSSRARVERIRAFLVTRTDPSTASLDER